ncbi:MAG: hypothetical protein NZ805_14855 [Armatimonadetes bacterium]|nr:hypothetical protein [Armatimonadota bacterium]MDW8029738.1 hypothetical protein [Armatimonadota bacterium]
MKKLLALIAGDKPTDRYIVELLAHAGIPFQQTNAQKLHPAKTPICLLVGQKSLNAEERAKLVWFVQQGGSLIAIGSTNGLDDLLGVSSVANLHEGWLRFLANHPIGNGLKSSLHVFGGVSVQASGNAEVIAQVVNSEGEVLGDAIVIQKTGKGLTIFVSADITYSIVHIQQGVVITKDGVPAPDGSAPIDDGILKAEDGHVLDWTKDRISLEHETVEIEQGTKETVKDKRVIAFFGLPIADELRALILQLVFFAAQQKGLPLPMVWYWQNGAPAVGLISHDTDGNDPDLGFDLLQTVKCLNIATTWCVIYPGGYPLSLYRAILDSGCEIALHFDAFTGTPLTTWSKRNFWVQWQWLKDATGVSALSNKNHYTRWEGRLQFFRWCEDLGIVAEQSKGPSKRGTVGFVFGGSHPWRPLDDEKRQSRILDVFAINLFTQDMVSDDVFSAGTFHPVIVPVRVGKWLLEQTVRMGGVAHFLFHPAHIRRQGTKEALKQIVNYGQDLGLVWLTSQQIVDWLKKRLSIKQTFECHGKEWFWRLKSAQSVEGLTLLHLLPTESAHFADKFLYGFPFAQTISSLQGERKFLLTPFILL